MWDTLVCVSGIFDIVAFYCSAFTQCSVKSCMIYSIWPIIAWLFIDTVLEELVRVPNQIIIIIINSLGMTLRPFNRLNPNEIWNFDTFCFNIDITSHHNSVTSLKLVLRGFESRLSYWMRIGIFSVKSFYIVRALFNSSTS